MEKYSEKVSNIKVPEKYPSSFGILIDNITQIVSDIQKQNRFVDLVFSPSKYLDILPEVYNEYPELKVSKRLKR